MSKQFSSLLGPISSGNNTKKQLRLTHTALHEAAHCVIACDLGEVVTEVKLDRRAETGWMKDSASNFHPNNEAKILLAGVAFERLVWRSYKEAYGWCESDFKQAFKILKTDESTNWLEPRIRSKGETPPIFKRELDIIERRLVELWPVVEYVAALILKNKASVFPTNLTRWSDKVRRCISDRDYLVKQARWVNAVPPVDWLHQLAKARSIPGI